MTTMDRAEFLLTLRELQISTKEVAALLDVDFRTAKRWKERGVRIPSTAAIALRAWRSLKRRNLPWRPNGVELCWSEGTEVFEQLRLSRDHTVALHELLQRVERRGGPASPWNVDLDRHVAELGQVKLYFYTLANGGFTPSSYSRGDKEPDMARDWPLLEDGIACIADAIAGTDARAEKKKTVPVLSEFEVNSRNLWRYNRILAVSVDHDQEVPGLSKIEFVIHEPTGSEGDNLEVDLTISPVRVLNSDVAEAIQEMARNEGAAGIVIQQRKTID